MKSLGLLGLELEHQGPAFLGGHPSFAACDGVWFEPKP